MKKIVFRVTAFLFSLVLFASCGVEKRKVLNDGKTPLERYGALSIKGTHLCDQKGNPVQLCGMSSHGLHWYGKYANYDVIKWLRDDWNCDLWRAAMYTRGGYLGNRSIVSKVIDSVESAKELGIYVIVDWHILSDNDPLVNVGEAAEFFEAIAKTYADCPNIIYEICNEPNGENVTWDGNIKPFAEQIIPVIRKYCDNIIVVGTPNWSSDLLSAAKNPISGQKNIMYTYHFYAGTTGKEGRDVVSKAMKKGLPVFVTEWGTTQASGDGGVFEKETLEWTKFMAKNKIPWANWSVNNKGEDSGILKMNKDRNAKGGWTENDLSKSGILLRKILRGEE